MKKWLLAMGVVLCLAAAGLSSTVALANGNAPGTTAEDPLTVPEEGYAFENGTIYGISAQWFEEQLTPENAQTHLYVQVELPRKINGQDVTRVGECAFTLGWSSEKDKSDDAIHSYDGRGYRFTVVGVADLSQAPVESIGKQAFSGCASLEGVILPETLKELGTKEAGSVFADCTGLQFVRTAGSGGDTGFQLPDGLETIGRQCFIRAFAQPVDAVIPASVTTVGTEAFYTDMVHHVVVLASDLSGYEGSAFKRSGYDERIIVLPNAQSYKSYVERGTNNSMREAMSYPYTAEFLNEGSIAGRTENHLYGQPLNTRFDPVSFSISTDADYALPAMTPPAGGWEPGYTGGWTFDGRMVITSQTVIGYYTYERDKCQDIISFVLQPIVAPPQVLPIVDGVPVEDGSLDVTVYDNGTHTIGVQVNHPLEEEPANPEAGDVYVDFRYYWTDVAGSFTGPRSGGDGQGGVAGWPDAGFNEWDWAYNTIPIEGPQHARSGDAYYMVEIEGYYTTYDPDSGWSKGVLFFKTASTIFGGAGEETNYYPPYCFRVDVEEDPNYQRYEIAVEQTGEGSVTVDPQQAEYDAGEEIMLKLTSGSAGKIGEYSIVNSTTGQAVPYSLGGGNGQTYQQLFFDMPDSDVVIQVEFVPYSYEIDVNTDGPDPKVVEFGTVEEGYAAAPQARKIYVDNVGDRDVHISLPTAQGYEITPGEAYGWSGDVATVYWGDYVVISIRPEVGLPAGNYDRTITITTDQGTSDIITVKFSVVKMYELTVEGGSGSGRYPAGAQVAIAADPVLGGKNFYQWTTASGGTFADPYSPATTFTMPAENAAVSAVYRDAGSSQGGGSRSYTLRYDTNGGESLPPEGKRSSWTKEYEDLPLPHRTGYIFRGWYYDGALGDLVEEDVSVDRSSVTLYAKWEKDPGDPGNNGVSAWLNTREHNAYLNGYGDGMFRPDDNMTRAQVAQMFYNLLLEKEVPITVSFADVPPDAWCAQAVNTLASLGIAQGIGGGSFAPDRPITRAEFTVMAMRFTNGEGGGTGGFSDVGEEAWFYDQVMGAVRYGWITGYEDGTFRPDRAITRAEVSVIVNRMLGRAADEDYVDRHEEQLRQFPDVLPNTWAYYSIMEAANSHRYTRDGGGETWTGAAEE